MMLVKLNLFAFCFCVRLETWSAMKEKYKVSMDCMKTYAKQCLSCEFLHCLGFFVHGISKPVVFKRIDRFLSWLYYFKIC